MDVTDWRSVFATHKSNMARTLSDTRPVTFISGETSSPFTKVQFGCRPDDTHPADQSQAPKDREEEELKRRRLRTLRCHRLGAIPRESAARQELVGETSS